MNGDLRARIFYERSDGLGCNLTGLLAFGLCGNEWLQFVRSEIYGHVGKRSLKLIFRRPFRVFELFPVFNRMIGQIHIEAGAFARVLVGRFFAVEKFTEARAF